jgi:hypothetical protein
MKRESEIPTCETWSRHLMLVAPPMSIAIVRMARVDILVLVTQTNLLYVFNFLRDVHYCSGTYFYRVK